MTPFGTALEGAIASQVIAEAKRSKVSQSEMAVAAGIGREALSKYLNGHRPMPLNVLILICERLGVSLDAVVRRAEDQAGQ